MSASQHNDQQKSGIHLPLFDVHELTAIKAEREELLKKLQKGGMDAHSRIRTQQKLALATAAQIRLELQLGLARPQ